MKVLENNLGVKATKKEKKINFHKKSTQHKRFFFCYSFHSFQHKKGLKPLKRRQKNKKKHTKNEI